MSRFIACAALAALIAGCSDAPGAPKAVSATAASFDRTPPRPPVTGDGFGTFSTVFGDAALAAAPASCPPVDIVTHFQFDYTTDASTDIGMNQLAHIKFGPDFLGEALSHQITIHQKLNEPPVVDAEGMIVGPNFSFRIISSDPVLGFLSPPPGDFDVVVNGVLKTPAGSCETSADFFGHFTLPSP